MAGFIGLILPGMVVTLDDDFWYLRSVIKTIQKGRPWTDDWLTPWAASSSGISALLFKITGSFRFAIHFQLAAAAGLAAAAMALFLQKQGIPGFRAVAMPLLVLATPTVMFMFLMFTGVAVYMACLWWCIYLADQKKWLWFLLPWSLAIASRQSAVAWLVLPAVAYLQDAKALRSLFPDTSAARKILLLATGTIIVFLSLKWGMNPTEGQKLVLGGVGHGLLTSHGGIPAGLGVIAFAAGLAMAALVRMPETFRRGLPSLRPRLIAALPAAAAGAAGAWWFLTQTQNTHDCYSDVLSNLLIPVFGGLLGLALALAGAKPRLDATLAGLAAILLVALYGGRFDYYFNDALFFGIAAGFPSTARSPKPEAPDNQAHVALAGASLTKPLASRFDQFWKKTSGLLADKPRAFSWILITIVTVSTGLWHLGSAAKMSVQQNRAAALITLYEQAFRSNKLAPADIGMTTFGYLGWLFQDYYAAHEGKEKPVLGGFTHYAQDWDDGKGTGVITTLPRSLHPFRAYIPTRNRTALRESRDARLIHELKYPFFGKHAVRFSLLNGPSSERLPHTFPLNTAEFRRLPFPLNDAEWRDFILQSPPLD
ncbi:MAG: hypothetical protein JWL81_1642 [Verrucomicrobiales bacterium]|nr:hypothetical protein [Verrucomicrobiales bacterium]